MLIERNQTVSIFDVRAPKPNDKLLNLDQIHKIIVGDITRTEDVKSACKDIDIVIHTASPPHGLDSSVYYKVNVDGTQNVIDACIDQGVQKLVFTSSASVVFNGSDIIDGDETLPYCENHMDAYNDSKCQAEKLVLESNGKSGLITVALRPSGIFGPGDMQGTWEMYQYSRKFSRRIGLGDNTTLFDFTYTDNVAWAHVLAAERATLDNGVGGQVFNITNDEPVFMWDFMKGLFEALDARPSLIYSLPFSIAFPLAYFAETMAWLISPLKKVHLTFSVFRMKFLSSNRYFSIVKAKTVLGYKPIVSLEEGVLRSAKWLKSMEKST